MMADTKLDNLTVLGAGVLGGQVAWHSAFRGKSVTVYDLYQDSLDRCRTAHQTYSHIYKQDLSATDEDIQRTEGRISFSTDLQNAVVAADIVIESVPEIPDVKTAVYREMAKLLPDHAIVATNSSTLLPGRFAESTGRPDKYCALHFANLVWALNVVEIMAHAGTSERTLLAVTRFAIEIGMVPIPIQRESNGYVLNAWQVPLLQAAQTLMRTGVSTPENLDRTFMIVNRGCSMGPCGIIDVIGMKTCYDVTTYWGTVREDEQMLANARYIKESFLDKGLLGLQSGEGYYRYPNPSFQSPDFLDVPDISMAPELALLAKLR